MRPQRGGCATAQSDDLTQLGLEPIVGGAQPADELRPRDTRVSGRVDRLELFEDDLGHEREALVDHCSVVEQVVGRQPSGVGAGHGAPEGLQLAHRQLTVLLRTATGRLDVEIHKIGFAHFAVLGNGMNSLEKLRELRAQPVLERALL
jgi:hypothetical protein